MEKVGKGGKNWKKKKSSDQIFTEQGTLTDICLYIYFFQLFKKNCYLSLYSRVFFHVATTSGTCRWSVLVLSFSNIFIFLPAHFSLFFTPPPPLPSISRRFHFQVPGAGGTWSLPCPLSTAGRFLAYLSLSFPSSFATLFFHTCSTSPAFPGSGSSSS